MLVTFQKVVLTFVPARMLQFEILRALLITSEMEGTMEEV